MPIFRYWSPGSHSGSFSIDQEEHTTYQHDRHPPVNQPSSTQRTPWLTKGTTPLQPRHKPIRTSRMALRGALPPPYELVKHTRDPVLSPESLRSVPGNETGKSPFIQDTDTGITLSESAAIVDYILAKYGNGRLVVKSNDVKFPDYIYWYVHDPSPNNRT